MNLENYRLVFEDHFDAPQLDLTKWYYRKQGPQRKGFSGPSQVRVENSNLIIRNEYREGEFGTGWYGGTAALREKYLRGYFEVRAICNDPRLTGAWSAFWLQAPHPYDPALSKGGPGSAEIDIMEAQGDLKENPGIRSTIHVMGMKNPPAKKNPPPVSDISTENPGAIPVSIPTCYTDYHTYGLEWTEEVYRFYVDGECYWETSWGDGVSEVYEEVILDICLPDFICEDTSRTGEFIVDYLRIYQKV